MAEKQKYFLDVDQMFYLIVGYETFEDHSRDNEPGFQGPDTVIQIRTIELMGTASVKPEELPDWVQKSIEDSIKHKLLLNDTAWKTLNTAKPPKLAVA